MTKNVPTRTRLSILGAGSITALSLALTSCAASDSGGGPSPTPSKAFKLEVDPSVSRLVPEQFRSRPLNNAMYNNQPPQQFLDESGKLTGVQVDFAAAVSSVAGLEFDNKPVGSFATIIPGLQGKRFDVAFADFAVTDERKKVVDLLPQFQLGMAFGTRSNSANKLNDKLDVCGSTVATTSGSYYVEELGAISSACESAGRKPVDVKTYPSTSPAILAVTNNRADSFAASEDRVAYTVEESGGSLSRQELVVGRVLQGIALPKGSELAPAFEAAMRKLIANGTYKKILDKWGISEGAITEADVVVNPAVR